MKIVLASASPRRRELLAQIFPEFEVAPSEAEEIITKDRPQDIVMELAAQKAEAVLRQIISDETKKGDSEDILMIGADTVVVSEEGIMGKPADEKDAFRMLSLLEGNIHHVYTGVCLILIVNDTRVTRNFYEKTDVEFYPMSEDEICAYIATGDPMDKAGAYGIQSGCGKYIRGVCGDYNNVVGLPLARLNQELKDLGLVLDKKK